MKTKLFKSDEYQAAAQLLKNNHLIAFPTETVYGLGAIATSEEAVSNVFKAKGRPSDNPLIVHVSSIDQVKQYVTVLNPIEERLMTEFWPGPLTIICDVLPGTFAHHVNKGGATIGIRMPRCQETLNLIESVGIPLVGPSANLSGKPSPTQAAHVLHDFDGVIAGVLSGASSQTEIGVESTVVRVQNDTIHILRPGAITKEMLQRLYPNVVEKNAEEQLQDKFLMSPGVKYTHYSPTQPVYQMRHDHRVEEWVEYLTTETRTIGVLANDDILDRVRQIPQVVSTFSLGKKDDAFSATQALFSGLRELERSGCDIIIVEGLKDDEKSHAYCNRLSKATNYMI